MGKGGKFLAGTAIGAAIGAVLGLLFAPKSGKELRKDIVEKAEEMKESAVKNRTKLVKAVKDAKVKSSKIAKSAAEKGKELISEVKAEFASAKKNSKKK